MEPDPGSCADLQLAAVAERHPFDVPRVLLAVVAGPYDDQRLTGSTVPWNRPPRDELARTSVTEKALERLGSGGRASPSASTAQLRRDALRLSWRPD